MSKVWRRLQRVGKTAYKFEFTIKVHTVTLECVSGWTPNQVSVLWVRRGRRVRTEATSWTTLPGKDTQGVVHWQALEATITLYMETKSRRQKFEDKFWTLIVENVGANGKHKGLATKRINMAEFVNPDLGTLETRKKYEMKPCAKKVHVTEVQVTFISKFERQGPATDEDMRSISSEMSELNLSQLGDGYMSENEGDSDLRPNAEENEKIMREIAAIGAGIQQLNNFDVDPLASSKPHHSPKTNGASVLRIGSHEAELIGWVNRNTVRYPRVRIMDMKESWSDAYAFCALIHNFRPDVLNIDLTDDPYTNAKLATRAASKLGIAPIIDALDFHKGKLDKLGIVTFVDQLYQTFKDHSPSYKVVPEINNMEMQPARKLSTSSGVQTDETFANDENQIKEPMKHRALKDSPKHKRASATIVQTQKPELSRDEEETRRREMIERGRLRLSKRRPNSRKTDMSASSYGSVNSALSLNDNKSPTRTPAKTVQNSPLKSPMILEEADREVPPRQTVPQPTQIPYQTDREIPHQAEEALGREAPCFSPRVITEATVHSPSGYKSPSPSLSVRSSQDALDAVLDSLKPDHTTLAINHKQEDQVSETGSSGIIIDSPSQSQTKSADLQCTSSVSLEDLHPDVFVESGIEMKSDSVGLDADQLLKDFDMQVSAEAHDKHEIRQSCDDILTSLTDPVEAEESFVQPSDIKISTIKTENENSLDTEELQMKLSESLDEAAMVKESILSEAETESTHSSQNDIHLEPSVHIKGHEDFQPTIGQETPPETPSPSVHQQKLSETPEKIAPEEKAPIIHKIAQETPPDTPEVTDDFDDQIQKEIDALEADLSSSMFMMSLTKKTVKEVTPEAKPEPTEEPISKSPEPEERKPNEQPTPPDTPPVIHKRGPSLRDKIRGLHESRQKLIAATSDSNLSSSRVSDVSLPTSEEKPLVPRRRLPNSTSSQGSSAPSIPDSDQEKVKPAVLPKPMDRRASREKIALLRAKSYESPRSSISSKGSDVGISEEAKPIIEEPKISEDATTPEITQEAIYSEVKCSSPKVTENVAESTLSQTPTSLELSGCASCKFQESDDESETLSSSSPKQTVKKSEKQSESGPFSKPEPVIIKTVDPFVSQHDNGNKTPSSPQADLNAPSSASPKTKPAHIESITELISSFSPPALPLSTSSEALFTADEVTAVNSSKRSASPEHFESSVLESSTESRGLLDDIEDEVGQSSSLWNKFMGVFKSPAKAEPVLADDSFEANEAMVAAESAAKCEPESDADIGLRDEEEYRSRDGFGHRNLASPQHMLRGSSSSDSSLSQPPPPPAPEPLMMMMGPGELGAGSDEDSDTEQTPPILEQDLQDVRDYITECHTRITRHNAKLDKRAKVLEKQLRDVMDAQNHELEQKLLKSWLQLVHERNTLVRKQDELNSIQNEEDLEQKCCVVVREMRKYQNMRESTKTEADFQREEELEEEYKDILKKREMLLRIREDINTISMEEEAEFQSVLEKPKLLQDQSNCRIS